MNGIRKRRVQDKFPTMFCNAFDASHTEQMYFFSAHSLGIHYCLLKCEKHKLLCECLCRHIRDVMSSVIQSTSLTSSIFKGVEQ